MAANADPPDVGGLDPCTDSPGGEPFVRRAGTPGRALDATPETLYLARIAALEAEVAELQARLDAEDARRQNVVDRYEQLLDARRDESPSSNDTERPADPAERGSGALDRLRSLLD